MGNFPRDWSGRIIDRDFTLRKNHFRDLDGHVVNERGYLIDEDTGDIRSKYTFDVIFKNYQLVGPRDQKYELPMPYRLEMYNFNPHQCFGNFDYKSNGEHDRIKDNFGNYWDKNLRKTNRAGWLIDENGNIIDNLGQVKLIKEQLDDTKNDIPLLYNYEGESYKIKSIMG